MGEYVEITDAAKRMSDICNGIIVAQPWEVVTRSWMAFRLDTGESDGTLYDSLPDARAHQIDESKCAYVTLRSSPGGMTPREAQSILDFNRAAYDAGYRMTDPDDHMERQMPLVMPLPREQLRQQLGRLINKSGKSIQRYREN